MSEHYGLSPYCVIYPRSDAAGVTLVHGLYGSKFELSAALLSMVAEILGGAALDTVTAGKPEARQSIETLIAEKVLIDPDERRRLGDDPFRNRLDPLELAVHRGFNEGGYFPQGVDPAFAPTMVKDVPGAGGVALETHDPADAGSDLARSLARRRSVRSYREEPLPKRKLEEFLQLTARAYAVVETPPLGTISLRNYPSGGARYPLEVYPVVYDVTNLTAGTYHYHPFHHRLRSIESEAEFRRGLLDAVKSKMGMAGRNTGDPAVLLVITAVFSRTCWKYRGIPYHLILQEVGALYQTMYLAATVLGLAPCAVGAFPELAVNELLQLDGREEAQVGLFVLGMPPLEGPGTTTFAVAEVRLRQGSPFSPDAAHPSVELRFTDGQTEIIDLDRIVIERSADGRARCPIMRGRYRAELDRASEEKLTRWRGNVSS